MDSASATSTAGDSSATWPSSAAKRARSEHHGRSPMMETAMPEGGNANRVWIFGFKRDFYSTYFLNIGTILLSRAGIADAVIKNCKVRAFNMKMRFSIDFSSVVIARDFTRLVNNMGYVATDPAAGASEHPTLRAAPDRSKDDRERIAYMTKAWKVVYDTLSANDGWAKRMALRSTGTDGVLFIENPEKTDGFTVVRMTFAAAGGVLLPTVR